MAEKKVADKMVGELAGKAVMWGPAIAGAALLGPVGIILGLATSVMIVASGGGHSPPPADGKQKQ